MTKVTYQKKEGTFLGKIKHTNNYWKTHSKRNDQLALVKFEGNKNPSKVLYKELEFVVDKKEKQPSSKTGKKRPAMPGSGRKKGGKNAKTIEKEKAEHLYNQRVLRNLRPLMNAKLSLAKGLSYLYRIDHDEKGKNEKAVLVTDPNEIEDYLDGNYEPGDVYYYITTDKPDNKAITDMFDRVFGKPKQAVALSTDPEKPLEVEHSLKPEQAKELANAVTATLLKVTKE